MRRYDERSRCASSWDDMIHSRMLDSRSLEFGGRAVTGYRPMSLAQLAIRLAGTADDKLRWKLVWGVPGGVPVGAVRGSALVAGG